MNDTATEAAPAADSGVNNGVDAFVSVPEAARRLGLPDRTAQRYAAKLADTDRTSADNGGPRLVRLSAITQIAKGSEAKRRQPMTAPVAGQSADTGGQKTPQSTPMADNNRTVADAENEGKDALIEQLRADLGYLKEALRTEQETSRALVGELTRANERAAVMIAATATGQMRQIEPAGETEPSAAKGQMQEASQTASDDNEEPARGFWARLWKAGGK